MKDYYKLLGIAPSSDEKEIKEAYIKLKRIFSRENPSLYSIYDENEIKNVIKELNEAIEILLDPDRRAEYDELLLEKGVYGEEELRSRKKAEDRDEEKKIIVPPDIESMEAEGSGSFFRRLREGMGLEIRDIVKITRIQTSYIKAIEEEDFDNLPPRVFVRGFVQVYARTLKVRDIDRIVDEYMKKYDEKVRGEE